jgi:hypothetical protein
MELELNYNLALAKAQQKHDYKDEALRLAIDIFVNLDSNDFSRSDLSHFFDFLKQQKGEHIAEQIKKSYNGANIDTRKLLQIHTEKILSCIPQFANREQKFKLLAYQTLHVVAHIKDSVFEEHGRKFSLIQTYFTPYEALEYYDYLLVAIINIAIEEQETWFCKDLYTTQDEKEVLAVMKYLTMQATSMLLCPKYLACTAFKRRCAILLTFWESRCNSKMKHKFLNLKLATPTLHPNCKAHSHRNYKYT